MQKFFLPLVTQHMENVWVGVWWVEVNRLEIQSSIRKCYYKKQFVKNI